MSKLAAPILAAILFTVITTSSAFSAQDPKPLLPRTGVNNKIEIPAAPVVSPIASDKKDKPEIKEKKVVTQESATRSVKKTEEKKDLTYSDADLKKIADDIKSEMEEEQKNLLADLRILWMAAVEKSETIKFAILKLSNPEGDQEKKSVVKKILTPLASVAPLIGAGTGDPLTGTSAMFGGGLLSSLLSDDSAINTQLSRVTDADLVILAQEIDSLQQKLVGLYSNYIGALQMLQHADKMVQNRYKHYQAAQNSSVDILAVADVFYREALDLQYKARQEVLSTRAALEQFVGGEAIIEVDKNITDRQQTSKKQ